MAVFLNNIPRTSVLRAKSFVFAFKESKLSDIVGTTNTRILEMFNIVTADVAWPLLSRNTFTSITLSRKTKRRGQRVAGGMRIGQRGRRTGVEASYTEQWWPGVVDGVGDRVGETLD